MLPAVSLLLDQKLKPPLVPATVQNLFYLLFFLSIYNDRQWWRLQSSAWDQVSWSSRELYYIKHEMEFFHCWGQFESVDYRSYLSFYLVGSKSSV